MHNIERLESEIAKELEELERIQGVLRNIKGSQPGLDLQQDKENLRPSSRIVAKPPLKPDLNMKMSGSSSEYSYPKQQFVPNKGRTDISDERPPLKPKEVYTKGSKRQLSSVNTPVQSDTETNSQIELPDSRFQSSQQSGVHENTGRPPKRRTSETRLESRPDETKGRVDSDPICKEQMYESLQEFLVLERQQSTQEPQKRNQRMRQDVLVSKNQKHKKDRNREWERISSSETSIESHQEHLSEDSLASEQKEKKTLKPTKVKDEYPPTIYPVRNEDEMTEESQDSPSKRQHQFGRNSRRKHKAAGYMSDESQQEEADDDYGALIKVSEANKPISRLGNKSGFQHKGNIQKSSREGSASKRSAREPKSSKKKGWTFSHEKRKNRSPEKSSVARNEHLQNFCHMLGERLLADGVTNHHDNFVGHQEGPSFRNKEHTKSGNHQQHVHRDSAETSQDQPSGQVSHRQHKHRERRTVTDIGMAEYEEMCARFREARMEAKTFDDKVKLLVLEVV